MSLLTAIAQNRLALAVVPGEEAPPPGGGATISQSYTEDTTTDMNNPDRGWYTENMYWDNTIGNCTYNASDPVQYLPNFDENDLRLELFYYDLGPYASYSSSTDSHSISSIPQSFLDEMTADFAALRAAGKKCLLRFAYDRNINSASPEAAQIATHWSQVMPTVIANQDVVSVLQGGFVGPYGEQWIQTDDGVEGTTTPNLTAVNTSGERAVFIDTLMNNTPSTMQVQWRQPFWFTESSEPTATYADRFDGSRKSRIAHYNDCIGSGITMVDTYNSQAHWDWAYAQGPYTAMGGETCNQDGDNPHNDASYIMPVLDNLGLDYMNATYWVGAHDKWNSETYAGENALQYLSKRMGYRIVLDSAEITQTLSPGGAMTLTLDMRNVGFGKVFNPRAIELIFVSNADGDEVILEVTGDARKKLPLSGESVSSTWNLVAPASLVQGETYDVYLRLPDSNQSIASNPKYAIRLANTDLSWNASNARHNLGLTVGVNTSSTPIVERYSLLGDESFSVTNLDDVDTDENGMTLRDWHAHLKSAGTAGTYDTDFNSVNQRPGNRQGNIYIGSLLMGLRLFGDLSLLDEAIRLTELWYSNMSTDGSGYLYLSGADDIGLDTNLVTSVFARVMLAAHENRALTSPAAHNYGAIADKYKSYIGDDFFPRELAREGIFTGSPSGIVHDYVGWRHDGAGILYTLYAVDKMGGGAGTWTNQQWADELIWFRGEYFGLDANCIDSASGREVLVMPFTIHPDSTNPDSYSLIYTTYVRYMLSLLTELWCENGIAELTDTWFTKLAASFSEYVTEDAYATTNDLARTIGGDSPPGDARCGVPYNGTYRPRVSPLDDRWQDAAYAYLEGWDSTGRIHDVGVWAWGNVGVYRDDEPNYAAARALTQVHFGTWDPGGSPPPSGTLLPNWSGFSLDIIDGVGSASTSYDDYPVTPRATAGDYYVDASVASSGSGTSLATAFKTLQEGLSALSDGQRLIVRTGTYNISSTINRAASWTSGIEVFAYGDERPVLNFSGLGSTSYALNLTGANEHWKGFEVQNTPIFAFRITGSNYKIEDCIVHDACLEANDSFSAVYIFSSAATNNLVQDFIAYRIGKATATGTNVCDVLTATTTGGAGNYTTGHKFVRCLGSHGPDDVYDLFLARNTQIIDSVAAYAGLHHSAGNQGGDGNGFKLGGSKNGGTGGGNTLKGSLAVYANVTGITVNGADPHLNILNNTAVENTRGFILDPTSTDEPHIAKNNLSTDNPTYNLSKTEPINDTFNSWNLSITNGGYVAAAKDWSLDTGSAAIDAGEGGEDLGASNVALAIAKYWLPIIESA